MLINELGNLIKMNDKHASYMSQVLMDYSMNGAELTIGPGAIDEYRVRQKKALYCTNYRQLYSKNNDDEKKVNVK